MKGCLWLTWRSYLEKIDEQFWKSNMKEVSTPLGDHFTLFVAQCPQVEKDISEVKTIRYACVIGYQLCLWSIVG